MHHLPCEAPRFDRWRSHRRPAECSSGLEATAWKEDRSPLAVVAKACSVLDLDSILCSNLVAVSKQTNTATSQVLTDNAAQRIRTVGGPGNNDKVNNCNQTATRVCKHTEAGAGPRRAKCRRCELRQFRLGQSPHHRRRHRLHRRHPRLLPNRSPSWL